MLVDEERIDEAVLALLWLTLHDGRRAWKGFDWEVLGRLHAKGLIADPVGCKKRFNAAKLQCAKGASGDQCLSEAQVKAVSIGHDLSRGTAVFTRSARQGTVPRLEPATAPAAGAIDAPTPVSPPVDRSGQWSAPMSGEMRDPQPPSPPRLALVPDGVEDDEVPF